MTRFTVLLISALALPAAALGPNDFAWRWSLEGDADHAIYRVALTAPLYRALHRTDGGDVLITDVDGQAVPFARLPAKRLVEPRQASVALDFEQRKHAANDEQSHLPGLELHHRGTTLVMGPTGRVRPDDAWGRLLFEALIAAPPQLPPLPQQRLHLSVLSDRPVELDCRLREANSDAPARTRMNLTAVADSRPLRLSASAVLAADEALPAGWHLACYGQTLPRSFELESVIIEAEGRRLHAGHIDLQPEITADEEQAGVFHFKLGGPFVIEQARIEPLQANVLTRVRLQSRPDDQAAWRPRGELTVATLAAVDTPRRSMSLDGTHRDRNWRLISDPALGNAPAVTLRARAEELVFLAQGRPPWRLYAGGLKASSGLPVNALLDEAVESLGPAWEWPRIVPTNRTRAAGEAALAEPSDPVDWQRLLLWLILALAAALLAVMAIRLLRQDG